MTAESVAIVTLAGVLAIAVAALAYLGYRQAQVTPELVASGKAKLAAEANQLEAERQRDVATVKTARLEAEIADALALVAEADKQRNEALEEATKHVVARIQAAPTGRAALDVLNELLATPLSRTGKADRAAAGGDRQGAPAVPPAEPSAAGGDRRRIGPEQP